MYSSAILLGLKRGATPYGPCDSRFERPSSSKQSSAEKICILELYVIADGSAEPRPVCNFLNPRPEEHVDLLRHDGGFDLSPARKPCKHEQHARRLSARRPLPEAAARTRGGGIRDPRLQRLPQEALAPTVVEQTRSSASGKKIRRRTHVVGNFPDRSSMVGWSGRPGRANDEWGVARRYMSTGSIAKALAEPRPPSPRR